MDRLRPEIAHIILDKALTEDHPGPANVLPVPLTDIKTSSLSLRLFATLDRNTSFSTFDFSSRKTVSQRCPRS